MSEEPIKAPADRIEQGVEEAKRLKEFVASVTECVGLLHDGTCIKDFNRKKCPFAEDRGGPVPAMDAKKAKEGCRIYSPYVKGMTEMSKEEIDRLSGFSDEALREFVRIRQDTY